MSIDWEYLLDAEGGLQTPGRGTPDGVSHRRFWRTQIPDRKERQFPALPSVGEAGNRKIHTLFNPGKIC